MRYNVCLGYMSAKDLEKMKGKNARHRNSHPSEASDSEHEHEQTAKGDGAGASRQSTSTTPVGAKGGRRSEVSETFPSDAASSESLFPPGPGDGYDALDGYTPLEMCGGQGTLIRAGIGLDPRSRCVTCCPCL